MFTIFVILLILWGLGLLGHIGGFFVHLLLVAALISLIVRVFSGRDNPA